MIKNVLDQWDERAKYLIYIPERTYKSLTH